jgi:hypothetical protein
MDCWCNLSLQGPETLKLPAGLMISALLLLLLT